MQSRRTFVKIALATGGLAALGGGVILPQHRRDAMRKPGPAVLALFGELHLGSKLGPWTIVGISDVHAGVISVWMEGKDATRFTIEIAQRDPEGPKPVAETQSLALYLSNGGTGTTATVEDHGLAVMALASELRRRESEGAVPPQLVKLRERRTRFPNASYRVFG